MDLQIALLLAQDGITNGAIYVLVALGTVLIFAVTRIVFVPFGDISAYAALTLAALQLRRTPGTIWLVASLAVLAAAMEVAALIRQGEIGRVPKAVLLYAVLPILPVAVTWALRGRVLPMPVAILLALLLVIPIAPLLYRIAFRPLADAPVLVLLVVAVVLHFAISGVALLVFGPEGFRTEPLTRAIFHLGGLTVSAESCLIIGASVAFSLLLFLFFGQTLYGKALRATAINRTGARLVGIRPTVTGAVAFLLGAILAGISGILVGPVATLYYDSGFILGLKAFVGAIFGGLVSYPMAAAGAVLVGLLESYAAFWNSAIKEIVVFATLIPILLWRSLTVIPTEDEEEGQEPRERRGGFHRAGSAPGSGAAARRRRLALAGMVAAVAAAPWVLGDFAVTLLDYIGVYALAVLGLVLITGIAGLTSFGQAAFVGIGAYATAWLSTSGGGSPWLGLLLALALTGVVAAVLGAVTLRLEGHFLPLSTVAWGIAIYYLFAILPGLGRTNGISAIPPLAIGAFSFEAVGRMFYVIWLAVGLCLWLGANLLDSREGRSIRALRGSAEMAESQGISVFRTRLAVFVAAALFAGLSGWLYALIWDNRCTMHKVVADHDERAGPGSTGKLRLMHRVTLRGTPSGERLDQP